MLHACSINVGPDGRRVCMCGCRRRLLKVSTHCFLTWETLIARSALVGLHGGGDCQIRSFVSMPE